MVDSILCFLILNKSNTTKDNMDWYDNIIADLFANTVQAYLYLFSWDVYAQLHLILWL